MAQDLDKSLKAIKKAIKKAISEMTDEEIEKYFPTDTTPKGWVSIEDELPQWMAKDVAQGYSVYKVKDKGGNESEARVTDHHAWYYMAKEAGITHWWND